MASKKLTAILELKDRLSAPLKKATEQLGGADKASSKLNESMKKVGAVGVKAIVGAGAAIGTAMAGAAAYSAKEFLNFEKGMNEVFTLLPGISDSAMSEMKEQVKDFSKEFSALPEEVVPALYQSLSAGVPQDNVFEFLEVAQKAAVGGVTELATAVDGISSVVNAYGADVIDATKTSDLMFTAVKLGKTNFEELSASLYNVIPTASSLGVEFGDVTAAMAAMTAQGTPTSVATTQMRQLLVELSKDGGKASDMFKELSGKSFKDFIASGGNVQDALQMMEKAAKDNNVGVNDLFSSVEAGNAALALTGKGTEAFSNALAEMSDSTGATEAAFDQMQQGIGPVLDNIRARIKVAALDLADKFAPSIESAANKFLEFMPQIEAVVTKAFDILGKSINYVTDTVVPNAIKVFGFLKDNWDILKPALIAMASIIAIALIPALYASAVAGWAAVAPWLPFIAILLGVGAVVAGVAYLWREHGDAIKEKVADVVASISAWWNNLVDRTKETWNNIKQGTSDAVERVKTFFTDLVDSTRAKWTEITTAISTNIQAIRDFISNWVATVRAIFTNAWQSYYAIIMNNIELIKGIINVGIEFIKGIIKAGLQILTGDFSGAWETMKQTASKAIDGLKETFSKWIDGAKNIGKDFVQGIIDGFLGMWDSLKETAGKIWDSITGIFSRKQKVTVEAEGGGVHGSHKTGLERVPFDGYVAQLHKNEAVLTASEADIFRKYGLGNKPAQVMNMSSTPTKEIVKQSESLREVTTNNNTITNNNNVREVVNNSIEKLREVKSNFTEKVTEFKDKIVNNNLTERFNNEKVSTVTEYRTDRPVEVAYNDKFSRPAQTIVQERDNNSSDTGKKEIGVNIAKLAEQIIVREEADIDKFARKLAKEIMEAGGLMA